MCVASSHNVSVLYALTFVSVLQAVTMSVCWKLSQCQCVAHINICQCVSGLNSVKVVQVLTRWQLWPVSMVMLVMMLDPLLSRLVMQGLLCWHIAMVINYVCTHSHVNYKTGICIRDPLFCLTYRYASMIWDNVSDLLLEY